MNFKQTFSRTGPLVSSILRTRLAESMASPPLIKRTLLGSLASITMLSSGLVFGAAGDAKFIDEADGSLKDRYLVSSGYFLGTFSVQIYDPDGINSDSFTNPPSTALTATSAAIDAINPIEGFGSTHAEVSLRHDSTIVLAETGDTIELQFSDELGNAERLEIEIVFNDVDTTVELSVTSPTPYAAATAQDVNAALFTVARYATKLEEQVVALENQLSTLEASKADLISSIEAEEASLERVNDAISPLEDTTPITLADLVGRSYCITRRERLYDPYPANLSVKLTTRQYVWTVTSETEVNVEIVNTYRNSSGHDHYQWSISADGGVFNATWAPFADSEDTVGQIISTTPELADGHRLRLTGTLPYWMLADMAISADGNYLAVTESWSGGKPWIVSAQVFGSVCDRSTLTLW